MASIRAPTQDSKSTAQTSENFYRFFQAEELALQQQMDRLADTALVVGERTDATEHCVAGIARLSNEVRDAAAWIPAHDQRMYSESIKNLQTRLQDTRAAFAPKPKFAFKTSIAKRPSAISLSDAAQLASQQRLRIPGYGNSENPSSNESSVAPTPLHLRSPPGEPATTAGKEEDEAGGAVSGIVTAEARQDDNWLPDDEDATAAARNAAAIRKMSFSQASSVSISKQSYAHILLPSSAAHATTTGVLSNLRHCIVDMSVPTAAKGRPFAGLTLRGIRDSLVVCGHVAGPAHVTKLENAVVVVACRQFRMHECRDCVVYLRVASRPIVEECRGVRFAPLPAYYDTSAVERVIENMWDQVDDFKWLKAEPSPNWGVLPEEERVAEEIWSDMVPGGPGHGLDAILRATGVSLR